MAKTGVCRPMTGQVASPPQQWVETAQPPLTHHNLAAGPLHILQEIRFRSLFLISISEAIRSEPVLLLLFPSTLVTPSAYDRFDVVCRM